MSKSPTPKNSRSHFCFFCAVYARLRYGQEYSGDWIVSSPRLALLGLTLHKTQCRNSLSCRRNLPHVQYELYDACLARDPITALNKMGALEAERPLASFGFFQTSGTSDSWTGAAGFRPCVEPPTVPASTSCQNDDWEIMLYKDSE